MLKLFFYFELSVCSLVASHSCCVAVKTYINTPCIACYHVLHARVVRRELKLMNGKILNSRCTTSLIAMALYSESLHVSSSVCLNLLAVVFSVVSSCGSLVKALCCYMSEQHSVPPLELVRAFCPELYFPSTPHTTDQFNGHMVMFCVNLS